MAPAIPAPAASRPEIGGLFPPDAAQFARGQCRASRPASSAPRARPGADCWRYRPDCAPPLPLRSRRAGSRRPRSPPAARPRSRSGRRHGSSRYRSRAVREARQARCGRASPISFWRGVEASRWPSLRHLPSSPLTMLASTAWVWSCGIEVARRVVSELCGDDLLVRRRGSSSRHPASFMRVSATFFSTQARVAATARSCALDDPVVAADQRDEGDGFGGREGEVAAGTVLDRAVLAAPAEPRRPCRPAPFLRGLTGRCPDRRAPLARALRRPLPDQALASRGAPGRPSRSSRRARNRTHPGRPRTARRSRACQSHSEGPFAVRLGRARRVFRSGAAIRRARPAAPVRVARGIGARRIALRVRRVSVPRFQPRAAREARLPPAAGLRRPAIRTQCRGRFGVRNFSRQGSQRQIALPERGLGRHFRRVGDVGKPGSGQPRRLRNPGVFAVPETRSPSASRASAASAGRAFGAASSFPGAPRTARPPSGRATYFRRIEATGKGPGNLR